MHIPDNYLSPQTCAVMTVVTIPILYMCKERVKKNLSTDHLPALGIAAALSFLLMMFNIPVIGGTTAHAIGGVLFAVLLGPEAACLAISGALLIQALFFCDGGIVALGANIFNIAIAMPFVGFTFYKLAKRWDVPTTLAVGLASYVGINVAAFLTAFEFGIQPLFFHDAVGNPLYFPYPMYISIPAMLIPHLTIAGGVETFFSMSIYAFITKTNHNLFGEPLDTSVQTWRGYSLILLLIALCPLGLLASGEAWGEWGVEEIADVIVDGNTLGYIPKGMLEGFEWPAMFPDYTVSGLGTELGYVLSACIGISLLIILFKILFVPMSQS